MIFAYLDPFTGSVLLQVLAAGFVGVLAFFRPILNFFKGKKSATDSTMDDWDNSDSDVKSDVSSNDSDASDGD